MIAVLAGAVACLAAFAAIERIEADAADWAIDSGRADVHADHLAAGHLAAPARLRLHLDAPWAGIYMLPLTIGMLLGGPTSGLLSGRFGARPFATGGMLGAAASFGLLTLLPTDFSYPLFALVLLLIGISMGLFRTACRPATAGPGAA